MISFSTKRALAIENNDKSFLEAGIHENVDFVGAKKERGQKGSLFIEFEFSKDGNKLTHTEWEPSKLPTDTDERYQEKIDNQVARILQIMGVYYDRAILESFDATSFEVFLDWVVSLMNAADKSKKLRLKVIYGQNGYTSLPKYSKYTFIESMDVSAEKSKIKQLTIDTFVRPEIGDKESQTKSASATFMSTPVASQPTSDIPF